MQNGSQSWGPVRCWMGGVVNQAALAAGAEATIVIPFLLSPGEQGLPRNYAAPQNGTQLSAFFVAIQTAVNASEVNVQYTAELISVSATAGVTAKVRQVGSAAGAQQWSCAFLIFDIGDTIS